MTKCDICSKPSAGRRCPICRRTYGELELRNPQLVEVAEPTPAQRRADRVANEYGRNER